MLALRPVLRCTAAVAITLGVVAPAACSRDGGAQDRASRTTTSTGSGGTHSIGGVAAFGPSIKLEVLSAAAWDGTTLWLADVEGGLTGIDSTTGHERVHKQLDGVIADTSNLVVGNNGEIWGFAKNSTTNAVEIVRITAATGNVSTVRVARGRPLGQTLAQGAALLAADYDGAIVRIDPASGASERVTALDITPNLLQAHGEGSFWIVDDSRQRLVRVSSTGQRLADVSRERYIVSMAADGAGNAWLAEGSTVSVIGPDGELVREIDGFTNAAGALRCGDAVVVSDVETGRVSWFSGSNAPRNFEAGRDGRAIACAGSDAWFLSFDGYLARAKSP